MKAASSFTHEAWKSNLLLDFKIMPLDQLVDYIIDVHHSYILRQTPLINQLAELACANNKKLNPELEQIKFLFRIMSHDLAKHMCKEEHILFPYIKNLAQIEKENLVFKLPTFKTLKNPLHEIQQEHDVATKFDAKIIELIASLSPTKKLADPSQIFIQELIAFSDNLKEHTRLENQILFSRALVLEEKYLN